MGPQKWQEYLIEEAKKRKEKLANKNLNYV